LFIYANVCGEISAEYGGENTTLCSTVSFEEFHPWKETENYDYKNY